MSETSDPESTSAVSATPAGLLLALREACGLTQRELAAMAGFPDYRTVWRIEKGRDRLTHASKHYALAFAFGLTRVEFPLFLGGQITVAKAAALYRKKNQKGRQKALAA